jgi:hypothetical protein
MTFAAYWKNLKLFAKEQPDTLVKFRFNRNDVIVTLTARGALSYFRDKLHSRIENHAPLPSHWRNVTNYNKRMVDVAWDRMRIDEYNRWIRHSGCSGLLRTEFYKNKYPHIDCQERI